MSSKIENVDIRNIQNTVVFPEVIVGIGGAGKKLVFSLLNKDWILREMLRPQIGQTIAKNYRAITIDTAIDEHDLDESKNHILSEKIDVIQNDLRQNGTPNNLDIDCLLLTKNMSLLGEYDIMGKKVVEKIKRATGSKYWWFYPPDIGDDLANKLKEKEKFDSLEFSGGVIRRRALGKAIFYKSISENWIELSRYTQTAGGKVAIIVGLGGGTGSGIFIDYARKLKERSPNTNITLFAILPTSHERDKEQTNGYMGLCELEYLRITGEFNKIFKDVILLSMEPTMYRDDNDMVKYLMDEFHDAFAYTFISYWDLGVNIPLDGYPYAPFIMASSCIMRYNIESNTKMIKHFKDALENKIHAIRIEKEINLEIENFLNSYKECDKDSILDRDDVNWLFNKLTDLSNLLNSNSSNYREFFDNAEYQSFKKLDDALNKGLKYKGDNILQKLFYIKLEIGMVKIENPNEVDNQMIEIFETEPSNMEQNAKLLCKINNITNNIDNNDRYKNILKEMVRKEGPFSKSKEHLLEGISVVDKKITELTLQDRESRKSLEDYVRDTETKIEELKNNINNDIADYIGKLQELNNKDYIEELNMRLGKLHNELDNFTTEVNSRGIAQFDGLSTLNLRRLSEEFNNKIRNIDNKFDADHIQNSADDAKHFRKSSLIVKRGIPIIDRVIKKFRVKTEIINRLKIAEEEKRMFANRIKKNEIFGIKDDDSIEKTFKYDIEGKLTNKTYIITNDIISKIDNIINNNFNSGLSIEQGNNIRGYIGSNNIDNGIINLLKDIFKYNITINQYKEKINNINKELDVQNGNKKFLNELQDLYNNKYAPKNGSMLDAYNKNIENFKINIENFKICLTDTKTKNKVDDRYVFQIEPQKESRISGRKNIKELLSAEQAEYDNLISRSNMIIENKLFSSKYTGIAYQSIECGADRWSTYSVALFISSQQDIAINKTTRMNNVFKITDNRKIGNIIKRVGDTWDAGFTMFVVGTFLDNMIQISDPTKGYYAAYQNIKNEMKELIFLHHTYLLDEGSYITREVVPIEVEENKRLFASNDDVKISELIKKKRGIVRYIPKEIFDKNAQQQKDDIAKNISEQQKGGNEQQKIDSNLIS